jgi:ABC-type uncharacterized transport system permease subunit
VLSALVALLGAFLLFLVQPMAAKAILPWFGGAPAGAPLALVTALLCVRIVAACRASAGVGRAGDDDV